MKIPLIDMYKDHTKFGERVYKPSDNYQFMHKGIIMQVQFDKNLTEDQIKQSQRTFEIQSFVTDYTEAWNLMKELNVQCSQDVLILQNNKYRDTLEQIGFKCLDSSEDIIAGEEVAMVLGGGSSKRAIQEYGKYFNRYNRSYRIFRADTSDMDCLVENGWVPSKLQPNMESEYRDQPLSLESVSFMYEKPNVRLLSEKKKDRLIVQHQYTGDYGSLEDHLFNFAL